MAEDITLTQANFGLLLRWLDADDNESAARKYETIRQRLIRIFVGRGCYEAETLADLTFDRVTLKVPTLDAHFIGDPAAYFYSVANNIHHEWLRRQKREREAQPPPMPDTAFDEDDEVRQGEYRCLESCLAKLTANVREMIVEYYHDEKRARIEGRRKLAKNLGISIGALQIKTSRVRTRLLECVRDCMAES